MKRVNERSSQKATAKSYGVVENNGSGGKSVDRTSASQKSALC